MKHGCIGFLLAMTFAASTWTCRKPASLDQTAQMLGSSSPEEVQRAVSTLRAAGPAGLTAALQWYDSSCPERPSAPIDAVAGQRGAVVSRLYWYSDLEKAKEVARSEDKPILYLRMLGKLTDEYSCANSRFFRTVLYSNANVSKILREHFVLVWISERPVPVVTIDYGDGRILKRTLTGNSIHYVLDSNGQVIDAFPGLYAPQTFASLIQGAAQIAAANRGITDSVRVRYLAWADNSLLTEWQQEAGAPVETQQQTNRGTARAVAVRPPADLAMRTTMSKSAVEIPLLRKVAPQFAMALDDSITQADAATWTRVAEIHSKEATLDASSIAVIESENAKLYRDPAALQQTVDHFQKLIALDSVHNNFGFRRQILAWLRAAPQRMDVEELNKRVYTELFLTPATDPWLGLMPEATYTALCDDGCVAK